MKPFDLNLAISGSPVITAKGHQVRLAGYNPYAKNKEQVVGWVSLDEQSAEARAWSDTGEAAGDDDFNLFMAPVKKRGWANIYSPSATEFYDISYIYTSEGQAKGAATKDVVATVSIDWEE